MSAMVILCWPICEYVEGLCLRAEHVTDAAKGFVSVPRFALRVASSRAMVLEIHHRTHRHTVDQKVRTDGVRSRPEAGVVPTGDGRRTVALDTGREHLG